MKVYKEWRPSQFDAAGVGCDDKQDWLVAPVLQNRDSKARDRSNFAVATKAFGEAGSDGESYEIHRFGHWACGWFEVILVKPGTKVALLAEDFEARLQDYPILSDEHFSEVERADAEETWACYQPEGRIKYIREHRSQFEFGSLADMLGCVRGKYFAGEPSELLR